MTAIPWFDDDRGPAAIPADEPITPVRDWWAAKRAEWAGTAAARRVARRAAEDAVIDAHLDRVERLDLRERWRCAMLELGFGRPIPTPLGGMDRGALPRVVDVVPSRYGRPPGLIVSRPPGVTVADLEEVSEQLADALRCWGVRFADRPDGNTLVRMIASDPLAAVVPYLPEHPPGSIVLGVDERGDVLAVPPVELTHIIAAGATRSGKSAWTMSLIAQLVASPDVLVVGLDPTGLLLDPLGPHRMRAIGTEDDPAGRYLVAVDAVVREMDRRIVELRRIRPRTDVIPVGPEFPLIVLIVEEGAAVAKICGHTATKPSDVHKGLGRLLAEGAKAGIRVVTLVQRAEATVIGSFERDQAMTRLTFAVNDPNTIKMLHNGVPDEVMQTHGAVAKGAALLTMPGVSLVRMRAPWIGGYAAYCSLVGADDADAAA